AGRSCLDESRAGSCLPGWTSSASMACPCRSTAGSDRRRTASCPRSFARPSPRSSIAGSWGSCSSSSIAATATPSASSPSRFSSSGAASTRSACRDRSRGKHLAPDRARHRRHRRRGSRGRGPAAAGRPPGPGPHPRAPAVAVAGGRGRLPAGGRAPGGPGGRGRGGRRRRAAWPPLPCRGLEREAAFERVNVTGTRLVADGAVAAGVSRLVFFSTIAVYGLTGPEGADEATPPRPESAYARTKLEGEEAVRDADGRGGLRTTVLRLAAVYGP